jgi:ABC-type Fe3+ transport system permease subunit
LAFVLIVFVLPYFFSLVVAEFRLSLPSGFPRLLALSLAQAGASATFAILIGGLASVALFLNQRFGRGLEWFVLFPTVVPALVTVLGFLSIFPSWKGLSAVVFIHGFSAMGLVAIVIHRQIRRKVGASLELAWVEGAPRSSLWLKGVLPAVRGDLARLWITVFATSLASFSVPLILGGSQPVTLEIAIHQAIRFESAWDIAAGLSLFQWGLLLALVLLVRSASNGAGERNERTALTTESETREGVDRILVAQDGVVSLLLRTISYALILCAPTVMLFALLRGPVLGWAQLESAGLLQMTGPLLLALRGSFVTATLGGLLAAGLLFSLVFALSASMPSEKLRSYLSSYVAPSAAITGYATLVIGWGRDPSFMLDALRIALGAALLFAPVVWRLRWDETLSLLDGQILVARTLGATNGMIVRKVIFPHFREVIFWSAGLVAFWIWGDYALGAIAASRPMTLALIAKGLLETYRLEAASLLILLCLVFGGLSYRIFIWGGGRVAGVNASSCVRKP